MTYMEDFLERNKNKSFISNLKKYNKLNEYGRMKCVTSCFTHLLIDAENNIDNKNIREEILSILTNMELYKKDNFLSWLEKNLIENN